MTDNTWAATRQNLSSGVCEQHWRRPACAYAQSDQHLCYSLIGKYHVQTYYRRSFDFLAGICSFGDWFESRLVGNPEDRFCPDEAHMKMDARHWLILIAHLGHFLLRCALKKKCQHMTLSANYVCCIYSNALPNTFTMKANTMRPDQAVWPRFILFAIKATKVCKWMRADCNIHECGKSVNITNKYTCIC